MSMFFGWFSINFIDPFGKSSRPVGQDSAGPPIIQVVADSAGIWSNLGFKPGDCFVWDNKTKTREKINCPRICHPGSLKIANSVMN